MRLLPPSSENIYNDVTVNPFGPETVTKSVLNAISVFSTESTTVPSSIEHLITSTLKNKEQSMVDDLVKYSYDNPTTASMITFSMFTGVISVICLAIFIIRCCLRRRDRIAAAYKEYSTTPNVRSIGWRKQYDVEGQSEESVTAEEINSVTLIEMDSIPLPPPPPPPVPVEQSSLPRPMNTRPNNLSPCHREAQASLELQLSRIFGNR